MGARLRLTLLAGVSGVLLLLLGYAALSAMKGLMEVPPQSWGMSELSDAVVAGTCAVGALGALWHLVSAVVALIAIPGPHDRTSFRPGGAPGPAARFLNGWGAPAARRIAASALVVSLSSAPALAVEGAAGGDDLGWRPTSSAPAPSPQSPTPSPQDEQSPSSSSTPAAPPPTTNPDGAQSRPGSAAPSPSAPPACAGGPEDSTPPSTPGNRTPAATGPEAPSGRTHIVLPGESLWSITAHLLPTGAGHAQVAQGWPALYRANADAIGPNPSLIRPGTVLSVPSSLAAPSTTTGGREPSR